MSSNYPNMSYCAAENTKRAVQQLIELIDSGEKNDVDRHGYEWRAIHDLVGLCEELSNSLQDLVARTKSVLTLVFIVPLVNILFIAVFEIFH